MGIVGGIMTLREIRLKIGMTAISYITDSKAITVAIIGDIYRNSEGVEG